MAERSVFVKLLTIMLVMAASLLLMVFVFFGFYIGPNLHRSMDRLVREYARAVASRGLTFDEAKRISSRLDVEIRYEGPGGMWTTDRTLPPIARAGTAWWRDDEVVPAPDGGRYLFAGVFTRRLHMAHFQVLALLLLLMAVVVVVTHALLRRLLSPLRELGDGVTRLSGGNLDVAVAHRTNDEFGVLTDAFNQMVRHVREMIRAHDQLLLDVSHELRSPVTRMKVALELIPDGEKKERMAADLGEMEAMISELLELERLREGRLRTERVDLVPLLCAAAARVATSAPAIFVEVDAAKLQTVLRNLAENGLKYSGREVEISAVDDGTHVVIRVDDDGPGIPAEDLQNIFEPFYRVDRSRSRKTGGYGLGLSISKRIVEAHGGTITAENLAPRGARFTITLPHRIVNAATAGAASAHRQ
jgi:signal transduction histidine kinase